MKLSLQAIQNYVNGDMYGADVEISGVGIDTRTLTKGACYIAIKGEHYDGNDFIELAIAAGAKSAIVERKIATSLPYVVVKDTRVALTRLANAWRQICTATIVGITGSNGKTTVKELIASILATRSKTLATRGNLNNDIGVPLTLLQLQPDHQFGVIEMGANHPGKIANLGRCVQPNIGVITNVGSAHIEGFGSIDGVAKAKGEIYSSLATEGVAIINADDQYYDSWQRVIGERKQISFGLNMTADVSAEAIHYEIKEDQFVTDFKLTYQGQKISVQTQLAGQHNVLNTLAASAATLAAGASLNQIKQGLASVRTVPGRMQALSGKHGGIIINDSYNANPASLKAALEVLVTLDAEPWLALGAFAELGTESKAIHRQMGDMIKSIGVVRLAVVGSDAESTAQAFGLGATFFTSQEALIAFLQEQLTAKQVLLIKGSRVQCMERVILALTETEMT